MPKLTIETLNHIPLVVEGDDISAMILDACRQQGLALADDDIVVVAQKIVSKAEGRLVRLADVEPGPEAVRLAAATEKPPELVQLILDESSTVMRHKPGVIIVRHKLGHVGANAGIDQSNVEGEAGEFALLLPIDPDRSAAALRDALGKQTGCRLGVLVADSLNRPWRLGTTGGAIGCAGFTVIDDRRGGSDMFGRELKVTMINRADSIAALATLAMGETDEGTPVAIIRGFEPDPVDGRAAEIMRPLEDDLFQ